MKSLRFTLIFTLIVFTACSPQPQESAELPTLVNLPSLTPSPVVTPTITLTPSATLSPTITLTPSMTMTSTITPSLTITDTPTPIPTDTPLPTYEPNFFDELATFAATYTVPPTIPYETAIALLTLSPRATSTGTQSGDGDNVIVLPSPPGGAVTPGTTACAFAPPGGFGTIFLSDPTIAQQIGCPLSATVTTQPSAYQTFERGWMAWVSGMPGVPGTIYPFFNIGVYQSYTDTYSPGVDPESGGETPPPGLLEPVRGFGKVWRTIPDVRANLGWATAQEIGATSTMLAFERGMMLHLTTRGDVLILLPAQAGAPNGSWRAVPGSY